MIPWNLWNGGGALQGELRNAARDAVGDWGQATAGETLPLRILDLGVQDVLSGGLEGGEEQKLTGSTEIGFAGIGAVDLTSGGSGIVFVGTGALRPAKELFFEGVDYSIETLGFVSFRNFGDFDVLTIRTVPALEAGVGLRLAAPSVPRGTADLFGGVVDDGLVRHVQFDAARNASDLETDYLWDWGGRADELANRDLPIYLTTFPGRTRVCDEVWSATVTPGSVGAEFVAYRKAGGTIPEQSNAETPGAGGIRSGSETFVLDGTTYTVNALGFDSGSSASFPNFWFHSTPALPRLKVLELSGNAVADVSPLLHLTELRYLGLAGNRVADPLGNLLGLVWLADNPVLAPDAAAVRPAAVRVDTGADGLAR